MNEPTPSDTPETDEIARNLKSRSWESSYWGMREHARTLERQRNEARAQRDALAEALREIKNKRCERNYPEEYFYTVKLISNEALATLNQKDQ